MAKKSLQESEAKRRGLAVKASQIYTKLDDLESEAKKYWEDQTPQADVTVHVASKHMESDDGDWHVGNPASDALKIKSKVKNVADRPHMIANHLDDQTDGSKGQGANSSHAASMDYPAQLPPSKQFALYKKIVEFQQQSGQLGAVSDATGEHTGYSKNYGVDMYDLLDDETRKHVLGNGGVFRRMYPDGTHEDSLQYHDAGPGGGEVNMFEPMRDRLAEHEGDAKIVMSGHNHGRYGWAKEIDAKGRVIGVYIAAGTAKGTTAKRPDTFMKNHGYEARGAGVVTVNMEGRDGRREVYPNLTQEQADLLWDGSELLELTEKHGLTDEVIGDLKIRLKDEHPKFAFHRYGADGSRLKEDHSRDMVAKTEHWKRLVFRTDAILPLRLVPVKHLNFGGSSSKSDELKNEITDKAKGDPHILMILLRQLFDSDVPESPDRDEIVRELIKLFGDTPGLFVDEENGRMSIATALYDGNRRYGLRSDRWKKASKEQEGPCYAATEIAETLGVKLADNRSTLEIQTPAGDYTVGLLDRLSGSGSTFKPLNEVRQFEIQHIKSGGEPHDFIMGGGFPNAIIAEMGGVKKIGKATYIAPGDWAEEWTVRGKESAQIPSAPEQSAFILPRGSQKRTFVAGNLTESEEMHDMLTLQQGAEQTGGVKEWMRKLGRRNRKHFTPR